MNDLFNGDTAFSERIQQEWLDAKAELPDEAFTLEEYQDIALNTHAFAYKSITDGQLQKELFGQVTAIAVIIVATVICPPAGIGLSVIYGSLEISSAVTGKDWTSQRELGTGERILRGALAPLDIIPGAMATKAFVTAGKTSKLTSLAPQTIAVTKNMAHSTIDVVQAAKMQGITRVKQGQAFAVNRTMQAVLKTEESVTKAAAKLDDLTTNMKTNLSFQEKYAIAGGGEIRQAAENTHKMESAAKGMYSKIKGSGGDGKDNSYKKEYSGDLMNATEAKRYDDYWKNTDVGSTHTYQKFIKANPKSTIDDYFRLVKEQSPWPDTYVPKHS